MIAEVAVVLAWLAIYGYGKWLGRTTIEEHVARALAPEVDAWHEWADIERATGMDPFPIAAIGPETAAWIFRTQLDDDEALAEFAREAS